MFRMWCKIFGGNHLIKDTVIEDASSETRTHKVFNALTEASYRFDIEKPIWLDVTVSDFKKFGKARFTCDCFIEEIDFDYLEIEIIEED